jgi:hypothetical protein
MQKKKHYNIEKYEKLYLASVCPLWQAQDFVPDRDIPKMAC